jgi:hypothetical protein
MKITRNTTLGMVALAVALASATGCEKKPGPAEQAGKDIDKAVENAGRQIERAGEKLQDKAAGERK